MSERIEEPFTVSAHLPTPEQLNGLAQAIARYGQETDSVVVPSPMATSSIRIDPEAEYIFRKQNDEQGRILTRAAKLRKFYTGEAFMLEGEQEEVLPFMETVYSLRYIERLHDVTAQLSKRAIYAFNWSEDGGVTNATCRVDTKGSEYDVDAEESVFALDQPVTSARVDQLLREIESSMGSAA